MRTKNSPIEVMERLYVLCKPLVTAFIEARGQKLSSRWSSMSVSRIRQCLGGEHGPVTTS